MARARIATRPASTGKELSEEEKKKALLAQKQQSKKNPLRRVRLACHGWVRDPQAALKEWVWCEGCSDWSRVVEVAE